MVGVVSYTRDFQLLTTDLDSILGFIFHIFDFAHLSSATTTKVNTSTRVFGGFPKLPVSIIKKGAKSKTITSYPKTERNPLRLRTGVLVTI
ncbi:hypothetical protein MTR_0047s0090 [Medicago truncatula]|uniref:Uncharacterized protein n=1 Tax=Medicago truncatula TaxID=3880 RepID=A0A072TIM8_MEDTR|nr:hypothetical protein MTR_0047s0090 [Medicago truncatula]